MNRSMRWLSGAALLVLLPDLADAQRNPRRPEQPPLADQSQQGGRGVPPAQRLRQILRNQLQLDDAQITRLQQATSRFAERRNGLMAEERQTRVGMRDLLCSTDTTRGAEVARSLDQLTDIQKRRMQLHDEEQKELATFLNPYQRAKYIGMQERILGFFQGDAVGRGGRGQRAGPPPGGVPPDRPPPGGDAGRGARGRQGPPPDGGMRREGGPPVPPGCGDPPPPAI